MKLLVAPSLRIASPRVDAKNVPERLRQTASLARHTLAFYERRFAERQLVLCNIELLEELADRMVHLQQSVSPSVTQDAYAHPLFKALRENAVMLGAEMRRLRGALEEQAPNIRAASFPHLVNQELQDYQRLIAGRSRLVCRPRNLARMKATLNRALESASRVPSPLANESRFRVARESARAQMNIVQSEMERVIRRHKTARPGEIDSALRAEFRKLQKRFQESFGGQPRNRVKPSSMAWFCDTTYDVELVAASLDMSPEAGSGQLLTAVQAVMDIYNEEHRKTSKLSAANPKQILSSE